MYYKAILGFAAIVNLIEFGIIYTFGSSFVAMFTNSDIVKTFTCKILLTVQFQIMLDFFQGVMCGTIKALGQQRKAAYATFVTYYIIVIPTAYYLAFVRSSHLQIDALGL